MKRLTGAIKITGTENFRLAMSKFLSSVGTNLQNPSQSLMRCIIPRDGYRFVQPDQSGAEALIVAYECRPARFRKLFLNDIKPHSYMALQIFTDKFRGEYPAERYKAVDPDVFKGYPEAKELLKRIKDATKEYDLGKRVIHAKNYNMGPRTFQVNVLELSEGTVVLSYKESKEFLGIHELTFPEIVEQQQELLTRCQRDGVLHNLFGYPRRFERKWSNEVARQALAFIPQSTVGTITNIAYTELFWRIVKERLPWTLLNNKHDSYLLEVPDTKEHLDMACTYCREHMGRVLRSTRGEEYRMKVGISLGYNWGKYSETNKDGMKEL